MAHIDITFKLDGTVEAKVEGVKGKSCTDYTKIVEEALGKASTSRTTSEYHEAPVRVGATKVRS